MIHDTLVWIVSHAADAAKAFLLGMCLAFVLGLPGVLEEFKE